MSQRNIRVSSALNIPYVIQRQLYLHGKANLPGNIGIVCLQFDEAHSRHDLLSSFNKLMPPYNIENGRYLENIPDLLEFSYQVECLSVQHSGWAG